MQKGLGDAVLCAENFAGEKPFVVALGDSILGLNARFARGGPHGAMSSTRSAPVA